MLDYINFDISEKFGSILNLVDQYRGCVSVKKAGSFFAMSQVARSSRETYS